MATNTKVEVIVRLDHAGYKTKAIKGKTGSCTYDAKLAVERLADKLFPDFHKTIERQACVPAGNLHSKWLIVPGEAIR